MRTEKCPNCGAAVELRCAEAAESICSFCRSILLADAASLEKIGLAAEAPPSASLIQVGSAGVWHDRAFTIAGRVVFQSEDESWNLWHLVYDDGSSAWLSDARRLYAVVSSTQPPEPLVVTPRAGEQKVFCWNDTRYYVTHVSRACPCGREGELPRRAADPAEVVYVSLLTPDGGAGFILYGRAVPELFLGEMADFADLHLANLRNPQDAEGEATSAQALVCPNCGGALTLRTGALAQNVACSHCLSLFDATHPKLAPLRRFEEARRIRPQIPLGARGRFGGVDYEVVGFQARTTAVSGGAITYEWSQYVLYNPLSGFRFLTEADGHWSEARFLCAHPDAVAGVRPAVTARGQVYQHFCTADAETFFVQGEFPWRLAVDEAARVTHFIHPPALLSSDSSRRETMWFREEYRTGREIWDTFRLDGNPPPAKGIAEHQPRPAADLTRVWIFGVLLLLIVLVGGLACDTFLVSLPVVFWILSPVTVVPAAVKTLRAMIFERQRWQRSDYNPNNARYREVASEPYMVSPYTQHPR